MLVLHTDNTGANTQHYIWSPNHHYELLQSTKSGIVSEYS